MKLSCRSTTVYQFIRKRWKYALLHLQASWIKYLHIESLNVVLIHITHLVSRCPSNSNWTHRDSINTWWLCPRAQHPWIRLCHRIRVVKRFNIKKDPRTDILYKNTPNSRCFGLMHCSGYHKGMDTTLNSPAGSQAQSPLGLCLHAPPPQALHWEEHMIGFPKCDLNSWIIPPLMGLLLILPLLAYIPLSPMPH